jgi:hypothetical protein
MKGKVVFSLVLLLALVAVPAASAQYSEGSWYTSYQIQNLGTSTADVSVTYYDSTGMAYTGPTFMIDGGGSVVWTQWDDTALPDGQYSAVIESTEEIAVIANQQLLPNGATGFTPIPPFSSYSGATGGSTQVTLPVIMYNWFGYYTEFYVQNAGSGDAAVTVTYYPGVMNGETSGAAGVTDTGTIPQFASQGFSQESMPGLGAPSGTWTGRFLGSAVVTADQPIVVVVNQHVVASHKLFTYNGFTGGATSIGAPVYMRGYFGYYASLTIGNPSASADAHVQITYTADDTYSNPASQTVVVDHTIAPGTALVRYDGPTATDDQSDLDDATNFTRFFGAVKVTSDIPVVLMVNQESTVPAGAQSGTYNGAPLGDATTKISVPLVQADFYGYYTSLTIQNTTGTDANITIEYTSDATYSAVPNMSKSYNHVIPANGQVNVYEGRKGGLEVGDINSDTFWRDGTNKRFIGSAIITSDQPIIAFVNEEKDVSGMDTMYTYNAFNIAP